MTENNPNKKAGKSRRPPDQGLKVRIPDALIEDLRKCVAEETERFGGKVKAPKFGELLERAWRVYRGRPEMPPPPPEPEACQQLKELLSRDPDKGGKMATDMIRILHASLPLGGGNVH